MGIVIYPPTIDWEYMRQRPQHVMSMFASHGFPVIYFNKQNKEGPVLQKAAPNLYVVNHFGFFMQVLYPLLNGEKKLYWSSWSKMLGAASRFQPDTIVYDCVDDFPDWEADEMNWAHLADMIVCTADHLQQKMQQHVPGKPITMIRNGCEWSHFAAAVSMETKSLPPLPTTEGFKIGYIGAWAPWVDEELVRKVATEFPESQVIIVGPKLREDGDQLGPNVFNLGYRDYHGLPQILSYLDVCIIPFRINRITESTNPIKVYEYLAAGKRVVSTNLPEVRKLQAYVSVADNHDEFIEGVRSALRSSKEDRFSLSQFARAFSWEQRFAQIYAMLKQHSPGIISPSPDPAKLSGVLDAMAKGYQSRFIPLVHGTVNSYYETRALTEDYPMVGKLPRGEYQCFMQMESGVTLPTYERAYLEFECSAQHAATMDIIVQVGISGITWDRRQLTFRNKPDSTPFSVCKHSDYISGTISVDVTAILQQGSSVTFHLSTLQPQLIGIQKPRLTIISPQ
ncbi:glycosyltransferase [Paenibacillus wynnii]|uniref:glycosyltransferase n=1 Tax=Paenibacillus wynnii TaxID=268407 RepID=UPI0027D81130|nr:glycosyltransferase [Paenibacillus wynnii]